MERRLERLVPPGEVIQGGLKTSFIHFGRVLVGMREEGFDGYLRLRGKEGRGLIFWRGGKALECWYDAYGDKRQGEVALARFQEGLIGAGAELDIVHLPGEVVEGLVWAKVREHDLHTEWVKWEGLMAFLKKRKWSGSVGILGLEEQGIMLLRKGKVVGCWRGEGEEVNEESLREMASIDGQEIEMRERLESAILDLSAAEGEGWPKGEEKEDKGEHEEEAAALVLEVSADEPSAEETQTAEAAVEEPREEKMEEPTIEPVVAMEPVAEEAGEAAVAEPVVVASVEPKVAVDWAKLIEELELMAEEALGSRSRKIKNLFAAADKNAVGVGAAIEKVPSVSLLFVDGGRMTKLATEMRAKVADAEAGRA